MLIRMATAAALGLTILAGPLHAQNQNTTINVNLAEVADQIAGDLRMDVSHIPATVQAPLDVAANVCGLQESDLAGSAACTAETTSQALNQIVQSGMRH